MEITNNSNGSCVKVNLTKGVSSKVLSEALTRIDKQELNIIGYESQTKTYRDETSVLRDNAQVSANNANVSATNANNSALLSTVKANEANLSANNAKEWASKEYGLEVETGLYSAKHYAIEASNNTSKVTSINGMIGDVVLSKSDVGLWSVDNTSDINKPISSATQTALNGKLDIDANAASATKLATARTINGVAFDGSANITVADPTAVKLTKLPTQNKLYVIDDTLNLQSPTHNLFDNPRFKVNPIYWADNVDNYYKTSIGAGSQGAIFGRWLMISHGTSTANNIKKINNHFGGLDFNITFDETFDFFYLRQLIPNIMQLSGKTLSFCIDLEVNDKIFVDMYVQARRDTSDATRVLVADTDSLYISSGRQKIACTFTVPDLYSVPGFLNNLDWKNSLEFAFRFQGQSKVLNVKVYDMTLVTGEGIKSQSQSKYCDDVASVTQFYEVGRFEITGLSTTAGQKRVFAKFDGRKIRSLTTSDVSIYDVLGNKGKISTYDILGARTDNVTPAAYSVNFNGISLIHSNSSTVAGIAFTYVVNVNY